VRHAVHANGLTDDATVGAVPSREDRVAEHDHRSGAWAVVVAGEWASESRRNAEQRERFGRDERAAHTLGGFGARDVERPLDVRAHLRERASIGAPVEEPRIRCSNAAARAQLRGAEFVQVDESVRLGEGKRLEGERVDDAERRHVRAYAKRERQQRDDRERPRLGQTAKGESDVRHQCVHGKPLAGGARCCGPWSSIEL
jgi:hypothetical protein